MLPQPEWPRPDCPPDVCAGPAGLGVLRGRPRPFPDFHLESGVCAGASLHYPGPRFSTKGALRAFSRPGAVCVLVGQGCPGHPVSVPHSRAKAWAVLPDLGRHGMERRGTWGTLTLPLGFGVSRPLTPAPHLILVLPEGPGHSWQE